MSPRTIAALLLFASAPLLAQDLGAADIGELKKAAGKGASAAPSVASFVLNMECESVPVPKKAKNDVQNPGPDREGANRAGYAKATLGKHLRLAWNDPLPATDAKEPFFAKELTMSYNIEKILLYVSSDFYETDREDLPPHDEWCPYAAILKHERSHAADYRVIAGDECKKLGVDLLDAVKAGKIPTPEKPWQVSVSEVGPTKEKVVEAIKTVVMARRVETLALMEADKAAKDGMPCYCKVYKKCDPWTWHSKLPEACKKPPAAPEACRD